MGIPSNAATEATPPFVFVPVTTNPIHSSLNNAQHFVKRDAGQSQPEPTNRDPVTLMAQQIATSKPNSSFTVPVTHILLHLSAWIFPTSGCPEPHDAISQSAPQGFSRSPDTEVTKSYSSTSSSRNKWWYYLLLVSILRTKRFINSSDDRWKIRSCTNWVFRNASNGTYCFHGTKFSPTTGVLKKRLSTLVETGAKQRRSLTMARVVRPV